MKKPKPLVEYLESGNLLIRFDNLSDMFWYDKVENNPTGIGIQKRMESDYTRDYVRDYLRERFLLSSYKKKIIEKARKEMSIDKEFLELIYKAKSAKRRFDLNRFGGNLSMAHYASQQEKVFKIGRKGAKKTTLNLAFQVGTFMDGDYGESFIKILKTILMCQALNINVNIDVFDSDTKAVRGSGSYIICNVAKSTDKLNLKDVLVSSHSDFFNFSLFNGYSACKEVGVDTHYIGTFLEEEEIIRDLSSKYDVIGGNTLNPKIEENEMVSRILKIGLNE